MSLVSTHPGAQPTAPLVNPNIRALIVDDELHVRVFLRTLLSGLGVTDVHEATDGAQALELYPQLEPTVVFMDVNMPVMEGTVAVPKLLEMDPDAAIIMLTGVQTLATVKAFRDAGVMGYIMKQTPPMQLKKSLVDLLACFEEDTGDEAAGI